MENNTDPAAAETARTTDSLAVDPSTPCWADLTADQRNTLIGERLGANPMRNIWLVWMPKKPDGSMLCKKHIGQLGDMSMEDAEKWLSDSKKSKAEWTRRNINLDWLLREDVSLYEQRWHINYSSTPGGGWMVIEAMRPHVQQIFVLSCDDGEWEVMAIPLNERPEDITCKAPTMQEAACELALLILPNTEISGQ